MSLPEITPAPAPAPIPHLVARQSIVTQTVIASTGISAPSGGSSSSSGGGFPVAVAVPALIGGMALALLGALGWWYWQRRRTREQKRRWEARQKRQNKKRGNSNATSRPSISGSRPTNGRSAGGMSEKDKEMGSIPPVPPLPTLGKEYGYGQPQPTNYQYPAHGGQVDQYGQPMPQGYGQYEQYSPHPVQPAIDGYSQNQPAADPFTAPAEPDYVEEYKPNSPEALGLAPPIVTPKSSSRGAKRVELAENAAARETANPNTRWRPNKPSPLALAAEKKRLESGGAPAPATLSPSRSIGGSAADYGQRTSLGPSSPGGAESNWEYQEELSTPNDPDYRSRRSQDVSGGQRQVSGEWGVAGDVHSGGASVDSHYPYRQSEDNGAKAYTNDPYLNAQKAAAAAGGMEEEDADGNRAPSGMYSTDPYAVYHGGAAGKPKVGGWV